MRVFLHIGLHKTGTTALQSWLFNNRNLLQNFGVFVPKVGCPPGKHYHRLLTKELEKGARGRYWSEFQREWVSDECSNAVLSDERLSAPSYPESSIRALRDCLSGHEVKIIAYIRNPVDYFCSRYRHAIRMNVDNSHWSFMRFVRERVSSTNEYREQFESWARVFGREHVLLGVYEQAVAESSIAESFCQMIEVVPESTSDIKRENVAFGESKLKALRALKRIESILPGYVRSSKPVSAAVAAIRHRLMGNSRSSAFLQKCASVIPGSLLSRKVVSELASLVESWPSELVDAGWIDDHQAQFLGKSRILAES